MLARENPAPLKQRNALDETAKTDWKCGVRKQHKSRMNFSRKS